MPSWLQTLVKDGALLESQFLQGVIAAIVVAALARSSHWLWESARQLWGTRRDFDIAGSWIGWCMLPSYPNPHIEIWRYKRRGGQVSFTFYDYNPDPNCKRIEKWKGGGVFRLSKLSAYYYLDQRDKYESGVLALELKASKLKGMYAQFDTTHAKEPFIVNRDYSQIRIRIVNWPFLSRLKMACNCAPFRDYSEALKRFEDAGGQLPGGRLPVNKV